MSTESLFRRWRMKAIARGWHVPNDDAVNTFGMQAYIDYWKGWDDYEAGRSQGRPVIPHRSGR